MLDSTPNDAAALMIEDLFKSGLEPSDMNARPMGVMEKAATRTPNSVSGYVLPYFTIAGKAAPFYRVKLIDHDPKYKQQSKSQNHVYFPKTFQAALRDKTYIILTEGEKKAALACKLGFPCVALGGVDSWRNRQLELPEDTELEPGKSGSIQAKVPTGTAVKEKTSALATGLEDLLDLLIAQHLNLIILYDTDTIAGTKPDVQRAAARLGFELRFRGISFDHIRQLVLPPEGATSDKVGLDDFLLRSGRDAFTALIKICLARKSAFPRYPAIQEFISQRLQNSRLARKETQAVSIAILSDLDATGLRLRNTDEGEHYYFNYDNHILYRAAFPNQHDGNVRSPFMQHLYKRFGIGPVDRNTFAWLQTQFTGEDPIDEVRPFKVIARPQAFDDRVTYQISDGQFAVVGARADEEATELPGLEIYDNGDKGILFEAGQVLPLDPVALLEHYSAEAKRGDPRCLWLDVLRGVRIKDRERQSTITALLYYLSPWLYRWRGTQLPVEMVLGEAGSGKSTLMELRLSILTGNPKLRNAPTDLRDWHASLAHAGGLHVVDNLQLANKELRQRLSDEICRLVTEPNPTVEMRKLYTNAEIAAIPVQTVFGITAIQQPFQNSDILQRSMILELDKSVDIVDGTLTYDSFWMQHQLARVGHREGWIAHHLYVMHKFFELVEEQWDPTYRAKHRLINFEQSMCIMAKVFKIDPTWIPDFLAGVTNASVTEADWVFQGLAEWAGYAQSAKSVKPFTATDIAEWAQSNESYCENEIITNPRRLGRYMQNHKTLLATVCNVVVAGNSNNRQAWKVIVKQ